MVWCLEIGVLKLQLCLGVWKLVSLIVVAVWCFFLNCCFKLLCGLVFSNWCFKLSLWHGVGKSGCFKLQLWLGVLSLVF